MDLTINHTIVFDRNYKEYLNGRRFIVNQGGSRSSKTYSIVQLLIFLCLTEPKLQVSVVRKSFPSLRGSVLRDFLEIMNELKIYDIDRHNKTEQTYTFENGSMLEFFSIDIAQKVRGRKRDICYCNEANELSFDDFQQLSLRTNKTMFIDFNPSDSESWLYKLLDDERSVLIKSTYKDNIYLSSEIRKEIENLINVDENYYKIYALGERPIATTRIYSHFKQYIDEPEYSDWCYGLDLGYNHNTSLVKVMYVGESIYVKELLYKNKITSSDLITEMKSLVSDRKPIYVDSARPDIVEELRRNGFNSTGASKQVKEGIDYIKSKQIFVSYDSENILKEYKLYSWKSKGEMIYDEPIKVNDDAMDSLRYAIFSHKKKAFNEFYTKIFVV